MNLSDREILNEANSNNWILVSDISSKRVKWLLSHSRVTVSNFSPDYIRKCLKYTTAQSTFGLFNRYDRKNALALATVIKNFGPSNDCVYLHELAGFVKGGAGRRITEDIIRLFGKVWCQCGLDESNPKRLKINEKLADGVYRKIAEFKEYIVQNSIWDCPANFFYAGIPDAEIADFLELAYSKETNT